MLCKCFLARSTYSMHTIIKVSKEMKINVRHTTPLLHPLPLSSLYCRQYISQNNPVGRRIRSEQLPQVANIP